MTSQESSNALTKIVLRKLDDLHCHFRTGDMLKEVLPWTAHYAGRGLAMPNTRPRAILEAKDVEWYRGEIEHVLDGMTERPNFKPLMTIDIRDNTTPEMVVSAHQAGAVAGKIYPAGVTTNSDEGLRDFFAPEITETFRAMRDIGMLLLIHGEIDHDRVLVTRREEVFLPTLLRLAESFPDLKIVLEHISTKAAADTVLQLGENVAATITAHHLQLTLNDVIGYGIRPHNGCMPMPKDFTDRDALIDAATSGSSKFFLGSDTAPHVRDRKECAKGACGVYSAPVLPQVLAEIFEDADSINRLDDFCSRFGAEFYNLPLNKETITLTRKSWVVPEQIGSVVPFRAGNMLRWQMTK